MHTEDVDTTKRLNVYYAPAYTAAACAFDTTRKSGWIVESLARRPIPGVRLVTPESITVGALETVHDAAYVDAVRTGEPRARAESNGLSWDAGLWTAVCASTGGVVAAVRDAVRTGRHAGSLSSGLHHARAGAGAGFCTFNGVALGARAALDAGAQRVAILDVDAHCGGGTASIVRDWPEIVHLDVSTSDFDGYDAAAESALRVVRSADDYLPAIARALHELDGANVDLVIYNAGMDPHQASLGGLRGVTFSMLAERECLVFQWALDRQIPVVFVLAGGYTAHGLSREDLVGLHRLTIASAARANAGTRLDRHAIMDAAYAGPLRGTEGFAWDANGRKVDAGFHADLLDDDDDPFAYDFDLFTRLSPLNQERFLSERMDHPGRQERFLLALLRSQKSSST